ncbi:hypothetical protein AYO38_07340 [bacterium SCGC AG-212-C10]|nr:hypothetical protein AYO38_07340 [bacterium SCGC AG-212-C10]
MIMKFGITMFPTDYSVSITELAKATEDLGFESLFLPEHTHIPASRKSAWPGGAELPKEYSHTLDPFVALGAAAAVTKTLLLGTGICLVVERDPIVLAKEVATLDFVSGGRVLFGIGGGWNLEEMENHGTRPPIRWKILRERILAMKEISSITAGTSTSIRSGPGRSPRASRILPSSSAATGRAPSIV